MPFPSLLLPLCLTLTIINEVAASSLMGAGLQGDQLTQVLNKGTNYLQDTLRWVSRPDEDRTFITEMRIVLPFNK